MCEGKERDTRVKDDQQTIVPAGLLLLVLVFGSTTKI